MGRVGLMKPCMRPIYAGAQVSGTAVTVLLHPGDNWMMHVVAEQIQPGDIVKIDVGVVKSGFIGDNATTVAAGDVPLETKRLMKMSNAPVVAGRIAEEISSFGRMLREPAAREAFTAFVEKRRPDFAKL
jgi:hypothetical protein